VIAHFCAPHHCRFTTDAFINPPGSARQGWAHSLGPMKNASFAQPYVLLQESARTPVPLSEEDLELCRQAQITEGVPVRFLHQGAATDIVTGQIQDPKTPEPFHIRYWNFDKTTAQRIAEITGTTPVFDESLRNHEGRN